MSEHVKNLIDVIANGDLAAAKTEFEAALADKMSDALDSRRIEIANSIYNTANDSLEDLPEDEISLDSEEE
jgi:hypothetical protein